MVLNHRTATTFTVLLTLAVMSIVSASVKSHSLPESGAVHPAAARPEVLSTSSRKRRNVAQLAHLVDNYTPYRSNQLLLHGNWCGYGGDRAHDGSIRDQCDGCCRTHDFCYEQLLAHTTENLGPNDILSNLQVIGGPFPVGDQGRGHEKIFLNLGLPQKVRRCVPYVDLYRYQASPGRVPQCTEVGGICSRAACDCDMEFVNCLRRSQCQMRG